MSGTVLRPDVKHSPTFKPGDRIVVTEAYSATHTVDYVNSRGEVFTTDNNRFDVSQVAIVQPVHESWHNVYAERTGNCRVSRRAADRNADADRVAVVHIRLWADGTVTADVEQVTA